MNLTEAIKYIENHIDNPGKGLPEDIFLFVSRTVPMVNVDLLIQDEDMRTLLAWRDDRFFGKGWHIPGGLIRLGETWEQRVEKVAEIEIGTRVKYDQKPIEVFQFILPINSRGHGISLLFKCFLSKNYKIDNGGRKEDEVGYLKWHRSCPKNLIKVQEIYRKYIYGK